MVDMLLSLTLFFLAHHNANAGIAQYQPRQLPPQSNEFLCRDPLQATNQDICDRQKSMTKPGN